MSIFSGDTHFEESGDLILSDALNEAYVYDELSHLPQEELDEFLASEACEVMCEEGMVSRRTLVRLSKNDDLSRRTTMAAFEMAKKNNDPLWTKLVKIRALEKKYVSSIVKKYNNKASKAAKISQKEYIKGNKQFFTKSGATAALKQSNTAAKVTTDQAKGKSKWLKYSTKTGFGKEKE